jgi:hypothetical protein
MKTNTSLRTSAFTLLALSIVNCQLSIAQLSSNKTFVLGTNNVLRPNETNFFAVNSNLLNASVAAGSGGGGGGGGFTGNPTQFSSAGGTSNIISGVALTNISAQGTVTTTNLSSASQSLFLSDGVGDGFFLNYGQGLLTLINTGNADAGSPSSITLNGNGLVNVSGAINASNGINIVSSGQFTYTQGSGVEAAFYGSTTGNSTSQEILDILPLQLTVPFTNDLLVATGGSNMANIRLQGDGTISSAGIWEHTTNVSGLSTYAAVYCDQRILCNPTAASCTITLPGEAAHGLVLPPAALTNRPWSAQDAWIGGGTPIEAKWMTRQYMVENLGSNTANTLTVSLPFAATNTGLNSVAVPNQMAARFTCTGTNGGTATAVEIVPMTFSPTYNGQNLTNLNASQLSAGTVPAAQLPVNLQPLTSNNGAGLTNLNPAYMNTYYLSNYGGINDGISDNTAALQLAILNAWTNGGGIVKLFAGTNWIKGPFNPVPGQTTTNRAMNCQVYFPAVSLDTQPMVTIVIEGASPPGGNEDWDQNGTLQPGLQPLSSTGSVLMSTNMSSIWTNAVFGTAPAPGYSWGFSGVKVILRDCICRQYQAASNDFWGMEYAGDFWIEHVDYDEGVPTGCIASNAPQLSTSGSAAFRFPGEGNWANGIGAEHVNVHGGCVGMAINEHFIGRDCNFWRVWYPWQLGQTSSSAQIESCDVVSSPYVLDVTGTGNVQIVGFFNVEHDVWGSNNTNSWMNHVKDVTGNANILTGSIAVSPATSDGSGPDDTWTFSTPATNLNVNYINNLPSLIHPMVNWGPFNLAYFANDNCALQDNMFYTSGSYYRIAALPGEIIQFYDGQLVFEFGPSGTAGSTYNPSEIIYPFKADINGNVAMGGIGLNNTSNSYTGATMVVGPTGQTNSGLVIATNGFGSYATNFLSSLTATAWTNTNKFSVTVDFPNGVTNFTLSNSAPYQILNNFAAPGLYSRHLGPGWAFTNTAASCIISAE